MKQTISSPIRKLKLLLVLPLMAGVFYAFAAPEYKFVQVNSNSEVQSQTNDDKTVTGKVVNEDGKPLKGASIVVSGKTIGTATDANGNFKLEMPDDSPIVISYVGFASQKVNPDFEKEMVITMKTATIGIDAMGNEATSSQPESDVYLEKWIDIQKYFAGKKPPLYVLDGEMGAVVKAPPIVKEKSESNQNGIDPETIQSIRVLSYKEAISKYGEKGKNGVVEIIRKQKASNIENEKSSIAPTIEVHTNSPFKFGNSEGSGSQPLIVKDGVIANDQNVDNISPETTESIEILKGEAATILYGKKGKDGVILIKTKKEASASQTGTTEVKVTGYANNQKENEAKQEIQIRSTGTSGTESKPLIVIDGVIAENQYIGKFDADSIHFFKGELATKKYGERGKNGVKEIYTKKVGTLKEASLKEAIVTDYAKDQNENESFILSPTGIHLKKGNSVENQPLIVIDGVIAENQDIDKIDPKTSESMAVLKDESATKKYGEKGKNGVVEITSKSKTPVTLIEEKPSFPGGNKALRDFLQTTMRYPTAALENGIQGKVIVGFMVNKDGEIKDVYIKTGVDPSLDKEAIRIIKSMPKWTPGKQNGEAVDFGYLFPINFAIPADYHPKTK